MENVTVNTFSPVQPIQKIKNIQALRGVAVLFVLFYHVTLMGRKWGSEDILYGNMLFLGQFGVALFFVISGFIMSSITTSTHGQPQNYKSVGRFFVNRVARIYPTYWFYSFLLLCVFLARPELINPTTGGHVNILAGC